MIKANPRVSVIIPTFNRANYIREAIESVLSQDYKNYEIIIVDDGSTDDTREAIRTYRNKINYFFQPNRGPGAARNLGVSKSKGEYIAFLDSDDIWLQGKLNKQVNMLDLRPEISFACSQAYCFNEKGEITNHWKRSKDNLETFESLREENFVSTQTVLLRRGSFNAVGGFDEKLSNAQDYDLWLRLARHYKFMYIDEPFSMVRFHSANNTKNTDGRVRSYSRLLSKKEIWGSMPLLKRRMRVCSIYCDFAKAYARTKSYFRASLYNFKALIQYPFVGLRIYYLVFSYLLKGIAKHHEKTGSYSQ